ncbi:uncharacterized protein EV420DRAFT_1067299, partial [Desarmillaria tabescens]
PTSQSDEPHIPCPSNCFLIFRSEFLALHKEPSLSQKQTKVSVLAAGWSKLPKERQAHYKELARCRKEDHARKHPGYIYKPRRSKGEKKAHGRKKTNASQTQSVWIRRGSSTLFRARSPRRLRFSSLLSMFRLPSTTQLSLSWRTGTRMKSPPVLLRARLCT